MARSEASVDAASVYSFTTEDTATSEELARRSNKRYKWHKKFAYQKLQGWRPILMPRHAGEGPRRRAGGRAGAAGTRTPSAAAGAAAAAAGSFAAAPPLAFPFCSHLRLAPVPPLQSCSSWLPACC